jgi:8-oxo-dGTP pyrophosphatase MutT (NUDIX family)
MGYIQNLRAAIGTQPIIMVGAAVLVLDQTGRLLMLKRTDDSYWGTPGGAMELGESLEEAARRETREETALELGDLDLFEVFSGPDQYYRYPNGDEVYNVVAIYIAREVRGEIDLDLGEHEAFGYFPLDHLPEPISPPLRPILEKFRNGSGFHPQTILAEN